MKSDQTENGLALHRRRARFRDIAALAGVSVPTVDRVLNDRGGVRPATATRVIDAARKLRLNRILPVTPTRVLQYEALLVRPDQPFFDRLNEALLTAANVYGSGLIVHRTFVEEFNARDLNERIGEAVGKRDGLIVYSIDDPAVTNAVDGCAQIPGILFERPADEHGRGGDLAGIAISLG